VRNAAGDPAANEDVRALPVDGNDTRYLAPKTKTDNEGNFTLRNVPPGDQYVQVPPYWMDVKQYKEPQSVQVTLEAGETKEGVELQTRE
jgi:hypothetical protein